MDDAEYGGVSPNTQSEHHDNRCCESRCFPEKAEGEDDISEDGTHLVWKDSLPRKEGTIDHN
jgi:hypothetical protein